MDTHFCIIRISRVKEIAKVNYIILDLEWNQPFNMKMMVKEPIMLSGEIIQIGAVKLDEGFHLVDTFKIMVTPKYYRTMHKKVSKLTNIKTEDLQYGFPTQGIVPDPWGQAH